MNPYGEYHAATSCLWLTIYFEADAKQKPLPSEEQSFAIAISAPPDRQQEVEQTDRYKHYEQCKH